MIAYFRLIRLPNVFTAFADIIAGYFLAITALHGAPNWGVFAGLCATSAALYLSGMAFNDIADLKEDSRVRPNRPIPSSAVPLRGAIYCACGLMLAGIEIASLIGFVTLLIAAALSAAILAYDFLCKGRTFAGPLALGVCRFLNVLLGMSGAYVAMETPAIVESLRAAPIWELPWLPALASGLYGAGVTAFSAQEEEGKNGRSIVLGWLFTLAGLFAAAAVFDGAKTNTLQSWNALGFLGLFILGFTLVKRTIALVKSGTPDAARGLVLAGVKGYCLLDASMLLMFGGSAVVLPALVAILMFLPGGIVRKWLAQREA